ncbi:MAG: hypothetical protein ACE148_14445 [Vicinamibacterales bacterium]
MRHQAKRPTSSASNREGLTDNHLAALAARCLEEARLIPLPVTLEEGSRATLQRLVDDRSVSIRHPEATRLIRRALAADLTDRSSRKGKLPRALGLVSPGLKEVWIEHQAIVLMMLRVKAYWRADPATGEVVLPYKNNMQAAERVAAGFYLAGINKRLSADNVRLIFTRRWTSPAKTDSRR